MKVLLNGGTADGRAVDVPDGSLCLMVPVLTGGDRVLRVDDPNVRVLWDDGRQESVWQVRDGESAPWRDDRPTLAYELYRPGGVPPRDGLPVWAYQGAGL